MSIIKKQLIFDKDKFSDIIDCIKDLNTIDKTIMFKIDSEKIFLYSAMGGTPGTQMKLFRSHLLDTNEYIKNYGELEDIEINYIVGKGDKLHKALSIMDIEANDITIDFNLRYNEDKGVYDGRGGVFKCGGLKVTYVGQERTSIVATDRRKLKNMISDDGIIWSFAISQKEFKTIKKIASLENGEDNKTFTAKSKNGIVYITEKNDWELEICEIDDTTDREITFVKKFFNNIRDTSEFLTFKIFETFIVVESEQSLLLMGFETSYDDV